MASMMPLLVSFGKFIEIDADPISLALLLAYIAKL